MKKTYLLILLSCISSINVFSSQNKTTLHDENDRKIRQFFANHQHEERDRIFDCNSPEKQNNGITKLKKHHAQEIAIHEQKIASLLTMIETKDLEINKLQIALASKDR